MTDTRKLRRERDQIHKNFHMIDFYLYSMEQLCPQKITGNRFCEYPKKDCNFRGVCVIEGISGICKVRAIRALIGHPCQQDHADEDISDIEHIDKKTFKDREYERL